MMNPVEIEAVRSLAKVSEDDVPAGSIGKSERYGRAWEVMGGIYLIVGVVFVILGVIIPYFIVGISDPKKNWNVMPDLGGTLGKAMFMGMHLASGCVLTLLGVFQLWPGSRATATRLQLHRIFGRVYVAAGVFGFIGGAGFTVQQGLLVGGIPMNISFVFYGMLVAGFALMAYKKAKDKDIEAHRRWAIRAFSMGIASFFYRVLGFIAVMIGLLPAVTKETGIVRPDRTMPLFNLFWNEVLTWAFWVIPVVFVEFYLRAPDSKATRVVMDVSIVGMGGILCMAALYVLSFVF